MKRLGRIGLAVVALLGLWHRPADGAKEQGAVAAVQKVMTDLRGLSPPRSGMRVTRRGFFGALGVAAGAAAVISTTASSLTSTLPALRSGWAER
jgi:hypothetical protein